jgi:hypothetical protein
MASENATHVCGFTPRKTSSGRIERIRRNLEHRESSGLFGRREEIGSGTVEFRVSGP